MTQGNGLLKIVREMGKRGNRAGGFVNRRRQYNRGGLTFVDFGLDLGVF